jgi:hypothetical protein
MKIGPVVAEDDGWWRQVIDENDRTWTIRVRILDVAGVEFYECWVNEVLIPTHRRRSLPGEAACLEILFAVGLQYIRGREAESCSR